MKKTIKLNESELHRIIKESVKKILRESFDPNKKVVVVGGEKEGTYRAGELGKYFEIGDTIEASPNPRYQNSPVIGYPKLKGYIGPMADGDNIRYESQEAYDFFSM